MEQWDQEYIDLEQPGYFQFRKDGSGECVFGTVNGFLDCRYDDQKDPKKVEFSWEGTSEHDPVSGRGWFEMVAAARIQVILFFHNGDESWVEAQKRQRGMIKTRRRLALRIHDPKVTRRSILTERKKVMSFAIEPTGYEKSVLSVLQGAWQILRNEVAEEAGLPDWERALFHLDVAMTWELVRNLRAMS